MTDQELIVAIQAYTGKLAYLKTLQNAITQNQQLTTVQLLLAKRLLTNSESTPKPSKQPINNLISKTLKFNEKELLQVMIGENLIDYQVNYEPYIKASGRTPYKFQEFGVNWLLNKQRAILADDMGLGKSFVTNIAALELGAKKILIVCPATIKYNWRKEIQLLKETDISVIEKKWIAAKFTIINYDKLHKYVDQIKEEEFELLVIDEAHACKNRAARRTKSINKIARKIDRVWLLTGTPISNRPIDFFNLLSICKHEIVKNWFWFGQKYCNGQQTGFGWDMNGASNLKELYFKTRNVILRRRKEDELDLPEKIRTPVFLQLSDRKKYNKAFEMYLSNKYTETGEDPFSSDTELVELSILRKFCAFEKVQDGSTLELISSCLEEGQKIVVFTNYTQVIDDLKATIQKQYGNVVLTLDGRIAKTEDRQQIVDTFQTDSNYRVIICNLKVGSVGITLTAATTAVVNDLDWTPATVVQAEDRLYRIGQLNRVNILYPIYENTVDQVIYEVIQEKVKNISLAVEGQEITFIGSAIQREIYNKLQTLQ